MRCVFVYICQMCLWIYVRVRFLFENPLFYVLCVCLCVTSSSERRAPLPERGGVCLWIYVRCVCVHMSEWNFFWRSQNYTYVCVFVCKFFIGTPSSTAQKMECVFVYICQSEIHLEIPILYICVCVYVRVKILYETPFFHLCVWLYASPSSERRPPLSERWGVCLCTYFKVKLLFETLIKYICVCVCVQVFRLNGVLRCPQNEARHTTHTHTHTHTHTRARTRHTHPHKRTHAQGVLRCPEEEAHDTIHTHRHTHSHGHAHTHSHTDTNVVLRCPKYEVCVRVFLSSDIAFWDPNIIHKYMCVCASPLSKWRAPNSKDEAHQTTQTNTHTNTHAHVHTHTRAHRLTRVARKMRCVSVCVPSDIFFFENH